MTLTRKEAAEKTRGKIIQAAYDIVGDSGYEALTSNLLIQKAGVAKGTLYHHFKNLDEVIYAVIESILEGFLDEVPIDQFDSMEAYLAAMGEFNIESCAKNTKLLNATFGFLPKGMNEPAFQKLAKKLLRSALGRMTPTIKQFYKGSLSDEKIDGVIRMIDMFSTGFVVHYRILGDHNTQVKLWRAFCEMLINYLEQPESVS